MFGSVCLCSKPFTLKLSMPETKLLPHTSLRTHLLARGTSPESVCLQPPAPPSTSGLFLPPRPLWHDSPPFFPLLRPPCLSGLQGACGPFRLALPPSAPHGPHCLPSSSLWSARPSLPTSRISVPPPSLPIPLLCFASYVLLVHSLLLLLWIINSMKAEICASFVPLLNLPAKDWL